MYVVVVGMGEVGRHVLHVLAAEGHEVVAVDIDAGKLERIQEQHDVAVVSGFGASPKVLREAGVEKADLLVAVTDNDEVNLVAALGGKRLGAVRTIARLQGSDYEEGESGVHYDMLGIDIVVNPRVLVAQELANVARSHGALDVLSLAGNRIETVHMELPTQSRVVHKPLSELKLPEQTLVAAVVRDRQLFVPGGADVLLPGDRVYVIGRSGHMDAVEDRFCGGRPNQRVVLVGGGVVGEAVARSLEGSGLEITIIEVSRERAEQLAEAFPHVTVLHGDGTELDLLNEEHIDEVDLFCALSHEDEVNLMAGLLARRLGARRVAALVHRPDYRGIYEQLGIDVVLSPRQVASDHILKYVRQSGLQSLTVLEGGQAEVLEFMAHADSRIVGVPLRRLNVPRGAILGAIVHQGEVRVPRGDDVVRAEDTVVVFTTAEARDRVERLFKRRLL